MTTLSTGRPSSYFAPAAPAPIMTTTSAAAPQSIGASKRRPFFMYLSLLFPRAKSRRGRNYSPFRLPATQSCKAENRGYDPRVLVKGILVAVTALVLAPTGASVPPPAQPGPWQLVGKASVSRIGTRLHVSRSAQNMKALAFVVTSKSPRKIQVTWASYCEFYSDDDYTESYNGTLRGVGKITSYPHVFDGATRCDVAVNTNAVKGARVTIAVFAY